MTPVELRNLILGEIEDSVTDLLFYDRKEDEDLPKGAIEEAIASGVVTVDDMVACFRACLKEGVERS